MDATGFWEHKQSKTERYKERITVNDIADKSRNSVAFVDNKLSCLTCSDSGRSLNEDMS